MPPYTQRILNLPPYPLATIPQKKRELIARGVDRHSILGPATRRSGPSDGRAGPHGRKQFASPTMGRYGFGMGLMAYREAIVRFMQRRFGATFDPMTEVVPLIGSKEGLAHLAFAYLNEGDVVIMPEPGYNAYLGGTVLCNATPYKYQLRADNGFLVDLDEIPDRCTAADQAVVLELSWQSHCRHRAQCVSRACGAKLCRAGYPLGVRQCVFRSGVRRIRST